MLSPSVSLGTHIVDLEGLRQTFHVFGRGPLCIAHPGGPGIEWDYLRMPLIEQHLTMLYVEPIGTGSSGRLSSHPEGYKIARYSQRLRALLGILGQREALLLGHSQGGRVAQHYALNFPETVRGLILYGTTPTYGAAYWTDAEHNMEAFAARHAGLPAAQAALAAWRARSTRHDDASATAIMGAMLPAYLSDPGRLDGDLSDLQSKMKTNYIVRDSEGSDFTEMLPRLAMPTCVVTGDQDFVSGPRWARKLHRAIKGSRLHILDECGHFAHLEHPQSFRDAIHTFLCETGFQ